ncbi:MAG: M6 family metalloprotease domain-containing protein, partial [Lachnospiraceae bacterium]|nr:M6 family metalloprotease domain-containing protein [Lachnospiraceae bacterium]
MKKLALKTVSLLVLFFFAVAAFGLRATAAPANPFPVEVEQADGSVITVRGFGDEFFHWTEADDGYVVAFDIASQNWCYAYIYDNEILPGPEIVGGGLVEARETAIDSEDEQATESANDSNNEQAAETIIDSEGEQAAETAAPSDDDETTATTETTETDSVGAVVNRPLPDPAAPPVIPPRITAADLQGLIAAADTAAHTQTIPGSGAGGGYSTTSQAGSVANWNPALLVILIEYDNASMVKDISHWHDHFFNTAPGYNSVNNFYLENSAGAFQYRPATFSQSGAITDSLPAGVASITVQNGVAKVKLNKNHPGNIQATIGADITAAYNAIRGYINFSAFPYSDYYGYIKSSDFTVTTVIAGWELSNSANSSRQQAVWAHARSSTFNNDPIILSVRATDKELLSYTTQGEIYSGPMDAGAVPMGIGVTAHELGHTFGLPDLYDTSSNSEGVGPYSVMASGSWTAAEGETPGYTPTHFDAWSKVFLGFVEPAVIASGDYRRVNVNSIGASPADYNVVKVTDPVNESQYFLIENRGLTGYDSGLYRYYIGPAYNNNGGIMIWHVDESVTAANGQLSNANRQRRAVDVEAADGNTLLYLKGVPINYYQNVNHFFSTDFYTVSGSGDYLGASGAHNLFAPATSPNSNFYAANGTSQSVATAIEIEINSPRGASMDVDFGAVPEHFLAIGPDYYDTLDEALAAVAAGGAETIRLLRDYSQDEAAAIDNQHIILDLNGFRLAIPRLELSGGGTVTIEGGTVAPGVVFQLGATEKTLADYADASATTKAGYRTYSDGGSTVWVKGAAPTIMGQASATAHLRKWDDYSEFTASYALVSDIAPRLDVDITEIDGATHTVSGGLLSLTIPAGLPIGAYTATVTADNGIAAATLTLTLVIVEAGTLDPPGQPDITYAGPVSATVVWEGSEGADDYWIYRNGVLVAQLPHQTDGTIQSWTDRAVLPEVSYIYRVTAHCVYNGNNIFEDSEVSDEYLAPPLPPLTGLWSAPATPASAGRVRLGWDMLDDVEAFEIYLAPYQ